MTSLLSGSNTRPCRYCSAILLRLRKAWLLSLASVDAGYFPAIELQMVLAPRSDIHLRAILPDIATTHCWRVARLCPPAKPHFAFQSDLANALLHDRHILSGRSQRHFRHAFGNRQLS